MNPIKRLAVGASLLALAACYSAPPPGAVVVAARPPSYRAEMMGVAPGTGFFWVAGYWEWGGAAYSWVPGRWVARPWARAAWVPGHWRGARRGWYWVPGRWR